MNDETPPSGIPTPPSGTPLPPDLPEGGTQRSERIGRARERQMRRQQQRAPMVQPSGTRRTTRQIAPSDRFKLPEFKYKPNRYVLYAIGSVILVVLVVVILGRLRNEPDVAPPNSLWIGTEWTYQTHDDETMQNFVRRLRDHQVGTVYAWVSWLQADQTWRGEANFETVKAFVQQFKRFYPEAQLYGWLSLPNDTGGIDYRLDNVGIQQIVADFSTRVLSDFGFDGVYLNVETVWNNDENFLVLLRKVRAAVGDETPISVAIPPDWSPVGVNIPVPPLIVPGTIWDREYKQSVALLVNEMAVMAYNSGLSDSADYSIWMAYQVKTFAEAVGSLGGGTEIVIGIPTYDAEPPGHDPNVETVAAAVQGVKDGLQQAGDAAELVRGLAIYADWTTDDTEWTAFRQSWVTG